MKIQDWIGYLEHQSNNKLNDFQSNQGKKGYTIFGQITHIQRVPWCAIFVHAVINRPDLLGKPHPGCVILKRRLKRKGLWETNNYLPQPGDIIFCSIQKNKKPTHCGIVEKVIDNQVVSIDGNTVDPTGYFKPEQGGAVARRIRALDDPIIIGYGAIGQFLDKGVI